MQVFSCMPLSLNQLGNSAQSTQAKFGNGTSIYYIYRKDVVPKAHCKYIQGKCSENIVKLVFPSGTSAPVLVLNYCPKCNIQLIKWTDEYSFLLCPNVLYIFAVS
jgi:hypothetical protein